MRGSSVAVGLVSSAVEAGDEIIFAQASESLVSFQLTVRPSKQWAVYMLRRVVVPLWMTSPVIRNGSETLTRRTWNWYLWDLVKLALRHSAEMLSSTGVVELRIILAACRLPRLSSIQLYRLLIVPHL